jgi:hypothetical protein
MPPRDQSIRVAEAAVESSSTAVEWGPITGGAVAAIGVTIILFTLGSGIGLSSVSPWSFANPSPTSFGIYAGLWVIITQWLATSVGSYLTGRLRTKWVGIRTDEVLFRDSAHGFLAWALATAVMAALVALGSLAAAAMAPAPEAANVSAEAAEQARRVATNAAAYTSVSLLVGAFIGSVAGALGGYHRDSV